MCVCVCVCVCLLAFVTHYMHFIYSPLAKGLDLYQVLAPNAYSYREEFIPVIRKTVQSQVHQVIYSPLEKVFLYYWLQILGICIRCE